MTDDRREAIESDIRIAMWNAGKWQGKPDEVALSLIRKAMSEPTMIRALDAIIATGPGNEADRMREAAAEVADHYADSVCLQRADGRGLNDARAIARRIRALPTQESGK